MAVVALRPVEDGNLDALFEQMRDPEGVRMAAFTPEDPDDQNAFDAHMEAVCDALQGQSGLDALTETLTTIRALSPPTRAATPQPLASAHRPGRPAGDGYQPPPRLHRRDAARVRHRRPIRRPCPYPQAPGGSELSTRRPMDIHGSAWCTSCRPAIRGAHALVGEGVERLKT
jgi:hypothetical protein